MLYIYIVLLTNIYIIGNVNIIVIIITIKIINYYNLSIIHNHFLN